MFFTKRDLTPDILADIRKEDVGQPNIPGTLARIIVQSATFSLTLPHFLLKTQCTLASFFTESAFLNLGFPYFSSSLFCPPPSFLLFSRPTI